MPTRKKKNRRSLILQENNPPVKTPEFSFYAAYRKSPFPPPEELEKYERLYPGVAQQFFDNFVKQTNHRMELEKIVIIGDNKRADTSLRNSFIITFSLIIMAIVLFILGKDGYAVGSIITAIVPAIVSFINSSAKRKEEREAKKREMGLV